jgi:hypothetical protein
VNARGETTGCRTETRCRQRGQDTHAAKDVAAQVLSEVDAVAVWKKLILQQEKPQVVASVMEYLTDRVYGRPAQTIQGNPEQPVTIQLQWSSTPEWLLRGNTEVVPESRVRLGLQTYAPQQQRKPTCDGRQRRSFGLF